MNGAAQSSSCTQQVFITADYLRAGCRQACVTGLGKRLGKIPFVADFLQKKLVNGKIQPQP
jgi:hypothetical protein